MLILLLQEALCDISLPRSDGTCTRCPFQITTTACKPGFKWSCKISLQCKFQHTPGEGKFGWTTTGALTKTEFIQLEDKSLLEHYLRLAQTAILNPSVDPAEILKANEPGSFLTNQLAFSPNVVALEVAGEDLPEVSLVDLPGAINVSGADNGQHLYGFVEFLLKSYLSDIKTLVLLVLELGRDFENTTAFRFVRECKAVSRCTGVLTKADLMTSSNLRVVELLSSKDFKVGHGWFVTKQLSQEELNTNIPYCEAREREQAFFATQKPWTTSLADFKDKFGIPKLQDAISHRLKEHILEA